MHFGAWGGGLNQDDAMGPQFFRLLPGYSDRCAALRVETFLYSVAISNLLRYWVLPLLA